MGFVQYVRKWMNENDNNRSNSNALWGYIDFTLIVGIQKKTQVLMSAMIVNLYFAINVQIKNLIISLFLSQQHIAQDVEART